MSIYPQVKWPLTWCRIIQIAKKFIHITKVQKTTLTKPPNLWINLNTDVSALENQAKIGEGGILSDQEGKIY